LGDADPIEKKRLLKEWKIKCFLVALIFAVPVVMVKIIESKTSTSMIESSTTTSSQTITAAQPAPTSMEPEYKWEYTSVVDDLTGQNVYNAHLKSNNYHSFDFPYRGETYGTLILRKHPRYGKDVIFQIDRGQILCDTYSDCTVTIRFDKGKPFPITGTPPADNSSTSVFLPYNELLRSIKNSNKMVVGITVHQEGSRVFSFDTKKLDWVD
jgi:hypothetical protein